MRIFSSLHRQIHHAKDQKRPSVPHRQVRAFQHLVESVQKNAFQLPIPPVAGRILHQRPALPVAVGRQYPPFVAPSEQAGVPEIHRGAALREHPSANHRIPLGLDKMSAVSADCHTLLLIEAAVPVGFQPGIDRQHFLAVHLGGSRKTSAFVRTGIRGKGHALPIPLHQIIAGPMSPVHRPPLARIRMILSVQMILTKSLYKPAGIVHPPYRRCCMVGGEILVINKWTFYFHICIGGFYRPFHPCLPPDV